jgi:hypothetical protein
MKISRDLIRLATAAGLVVSAVSALAQDVPPCRSRSVNVEHAINAPKSTGTVGFFCVQGSPARVHLEVDQMTITSVLSALRTAYNISYSSSIALNEIRDGVYAGSLRQVISHLLRNYNYVIKLENASFDVDIFGKIGEQAIPTPIANEVRESSARPTHRVSRNR